MDINLHTKYFVRSLLAYELLTLRGPIFSTYAALRDKLINRPGDVCILRKRGFITGDVGERDVCDLWHSPVLHMELDILASRVDEILLMKKRERSFVQRTIANLRRRIPSVYLVLSLLAAAILLVTAILQTSYTSRVFTRVLRLEGLRLIVR
ncbi:hypothetical protein R1flu_024969 [Riccia fluitans]|uniref:Uncharacterized protein n=1 Tax=Riccia fluitans TaxID=41844 RepID=A0ABD1XWF2_9MARC